MADKLTWFTCSYRVGERTFAVHIEGRDWADASARLRAIGTRGKVDGELLLHGDLFPSFSMRRWVKKVARTLLYGEWI